MVNSTDIDESLKECELSLVSDSVACDRRNAVFYSFISISYNDDGSRSPNSTRLKKITSHIKKSMMF